MGKLISFPSRPARALSDVDRALAEAEAERCALLEKRRRIDNEITRLWARRAEVSSDLRQVNEDIALLNRDRAQRGGVA